MHEMICWTPPHEDIFGVISKKFITKASVGWVERSGTHRFFRHERERLRGRTMSSHPPRGQTDFVLLGVDVVRAHTERHGL